MKSSSIYISFYHQNPGNNFFEVHFVALQISSQFNCKLQPRGNKEEKLKLSILSIIKSRHLVVRALHFIGCVRFDQLTQIIQAFAAWWPHTVGGLKSAQVKNASAL